MNFREGFRRPVRSNLTHRRKRRLPDTKGTKKRVGQQRDMMAGERFLRARRAQGAGKAEGLKRTIYSPLDMLRVHGSDPYSLGIGVPRACCYSGKISTA